ncbi:MAG: hypothetical protein EB104_04360, partial [Acidimicrobiia bacterium]|nr:hypothetical protein [Acidimicrobiia bacterium]
DTISFLSDYGTRDEFVGIVKSVIADLAPHARVIDLTHEIAPFDVRAGSLALARCISYVPSGIVLAVVDPGVGTARRPIAVSVGGGRGVLIGPDNGLLSMGVALAGGADAAVVLNNVEHHLAAPGATFAGRDIFAPAAAHLCNGVALSDLGEAIDPALLLPGVVPLSRTENGVLRLRAASTAATIASRTRSRSSTATPAAVVPLGDVTRARNSLAACGSRANNALEPAKSWAINLALVSASNPPAALAATHAA